MKKYEEKKQKKKRDADKDCKKKFDKEKKKFEKEKTNYEKKKKTKKDNWVKAKAKQKKCMKKRIKITCKKHPPKEPNYGSAPTEPARDDVCKQIYNRPEVKKPKLKLPKKPTKPNKGSVCQSIYNREARQRKNAVKQAAKYGFDV